MILAHRDDINTIRAVFLLCILHHGMSAKFLLIGTLSTSHQQEMVSYGAGLQERGHHVYAALPQGDRHVTLVQSYGINVIYYKANIEADYKTKARQQLYSKLLFLERNVQKLGNIFTDNIRELCRGMMKDEKFKDTVKSMGFHLAIVDAFLLENCLLVVPYNLSIPYVAASPSLNPWDIGLPMFPSFTPNPLLGYSHFMTFWQRSISFATTLVMSSRFFPVVQDPSIIKQFAPEVQSQKDVLHKAQMFIITRDHHLEWPAIQMPHVLTLPGITQRPAQPIVDKPLVQIIEKSQELILVTFGTTASGDMMPASYRNKFVDAFRQFPNYTFLWQLNKDFLPKDEQEYFSTATNVVLLKWLPQNDILGHPKTKLFLTHCGNYGQYEAIYHGIPMLGYPLFAEQSHNAFRMQSHGFGLTIDIHHFTVDDLVHKMRILLTSPEYKLNLRRISNILRSRPLPYQEAAFNLELIADHGGQHLMPATLSIPWYQVLMIDILTFLFIFCAMVIYLLRCFVKVVFKYCSKQQKKLKAK